MTIRIRRRWGHAAAAALVCGGLGVIPAESASAGTASTATLDLVGCAIDGGGTTVPAGSTVDFALGWEVAHRGLEHAFLNDVTVTASLTGETIVDAKSYFGPIEPAPFLSTGTWETVWLYPTGVTVSSGESVTMTIRWVLPHPAPSGYTVGFFRSVGTTTTPSKPTHAMLLQHGTVATFTCTVTGS